jgi:hypothetical protein
MAAKTYRKTALVTADQFLPAIGQIPNGVFSNGRGDPRKRYDCEWVLNTKEGQHYVRDGDYICTGPAGEQWNVEKDIFEATYEEVADPTPATIVSGIAEGMIQSVCELQELPDIDHPETIIINVDDLRTIIENHLERAAPKDSPVSSLEGRVSQLETELAEAVHWRDVYLRERNEDRATFFRRAGELWQPLYDRAMAKADAAEDSPVSRTGGIEDEIEQYQAERADRGMPEDPTAYPDWHDPNERGDPPLRADLKSRFEYLNSAEMIAVTDAKRSASDQAWDAYDDAKQKALDDLRAALAAIETEGE